MLREKIFRLHRHKSSSSSSDASSGQKFDFNFSNLQAIQVPKGWDKVCLSLVSSESGKVVRKTGKVAVKNGGCLWTETFSESIWVDGSKELEEYLFRFLVASGTSKSGILGETTLNLASFLSTESPMLVSLPLKKCNHGTILQVEVKCLTPKRNPRYEKWKGMHAIRDENADHDSTENQSDTSDCTTAKSTESFSSNSVGNSSRPREETSFSASVSRYSFESVDDSVGQSFSSQSEQNGGSTIILRQDSIESNDSSSYGSYSTQASVKSVRSHQSKSQREELRKLSNATALLLQQNGGSLKTYEEADDAVVQELDAEANMWEQNARKLSVDMERLRKELSDQKMNVTNLNTELARSRSECQEFTQEIRQLKLLLDEASLKQNVGQDAELQGEIRFQKEENEHLCLQLKKTQESNLELISILQEMEETIDKQKLQIESLSMEENHEEDNRILEFDLLNVQEVQRALQGEIVVLESSLQEKIIETEIEQDLKNQILKEFVVKCRHTLAAKEEEIMILEAAASRALLDEASKETKLSEEVRQLKEKIQELEANSNILTEENLVEKIDKSMMDQENSEIEWAKHLSELQEENLYLMQRVCGLEAQLRYITDKSEASCLGLQHSQSKAVNEIRRMEEEVESEKLKMMQKLLDMEKLLLEAQEERTALSKLNRRLQATTENLVEEYTYLQKFNEEIREQKMKLQEHCLVLESEARKYGEDLEDSDKENKVVFVANQEKGLIMFENVMNSESKRKSIIVELEAARIKLSENERLRLADENSLLHIRLQKVAELQNEVLALRVSCNEMKSQNQLLESSFKSVSEHYEDLKREKTSMAEKYSSMLSEGEDCRRRRNALEEKILRLEGDLIARDALCVENAEMKNEVNRIKIANSQLLKTVKHVEDLQSRVQFLEQKLKQTGHGEEIRSQSTSEISPVNRELVQVFEKRDSNCRRCQACESKIQLLESELAKALTSNALKSGGEKRSESRGVEEELEEIRDRYLEISLKYAEVESQREELVMKLRASSFS